MSKLIQLPLVMASLLLFSHSNYAQTIKGKLIFHGSGVAKGQKVILVPRTSSSEAVVASAAFMGSDRRQLESMQAAVSYTNNEGYYYFSRIRPGRYILKVCCSRGTIYKFTVPSTYQLLAIRDLSVY